jgi:hypothetical protein
VRVKKGDVDVALALPSMTVSYKSGSYDNMYLSAVVAAILLGPVAGFGLQRAPRNLVRLSDAKKPGDKLVYDKTSGAMVEHLC